MQHYISKYNLLLLSFKSCNNQKKPHTHKQIWAYMPLTYKNQRRKKNAAFDCKAHEVLQAPFECAFFILTNETSHRKWRNLKKSLKGRGGKMKEAVILSANDVAEIMGYSATWVRYLTRIGKIKGFKAYGGALRYKYRREDIEKLKINISEI